MSQNEVLTGKSNVIAITDPFTADIVIKPDLPSDKLFSAVGVSILLIFMADESALFFLLLILIILVSPIILILDQFKLTQWLERKSFIKSYQFPTVIKARISAQFPHLCDEELLLVMQGLRQYLLLCSYADGKVLAMPSKVVDDAWHEFILITQAYNEFCLLGIGRFLHHTPAEEIGSETILAEGMLSSWELACRWEEINSASPTKLPFLFAIDQELNISNGSIYSLNNDCVIQLNNDTNRCCG
ncbi:hypothetical protein C8R27_1374 [Nitrosomonas ureae]|uniref:glycine-rich domain-containing protein n=1 Tax=Nitrosomonas ureae TaxID=44577 RepID=UPI000D76DD51|nr:hypothetical protein [Nitrosomonas ureae]PXX09479.1 hypothetical protein C8R27_1374 [Nitrosomonas ureae]